jgi:acetyl esterase/lipase
MAFPTAERIPYGKDENQFILYFDDDDAVDSDRTGRTIFVILHGGYFKSKYGVENSCVDSLPSHLLRLGYAVCLVEYRRTGHVGGGWPGTNEDVYEALIKLADVAKNNKKERFSNVVILGHSAGGTLALWVCMNGRNQALSEAFIGARLFCVAVAPIGDLEAGHSRRLSDDGDAIPLYMGCDPVGDSATDLLAATCPYRYEK